MKIINVSEGPIYLDDINIALPYTGRHDIIDIPDLKALRSNTLRFCIAGKYCLDASKKVPSEQEIKNAQTEFKARLSEAEAQPSKYEKLKSLLVDDTKPNIPKRPASYHGIPVCKVAKESFKQDGKMSVVYSGPATDAGGFSRMNKRFMFGLEDKGVNLRYDLTPSIDDMDRKTKERINKLMTVKVPHDAPKIYGMTAPLIYDWSRYKMLFTMMETRHLHPAYVERSNCADEIVVPSKWCKEVFIESGVKKPIAVVPLGVDTSIYRPDVEPISFSKDLKDFVFLSVFGWSSRKGPDVLLKAYLEEFTGDDPVSLLISSRYFGSTDESKKQVIRNEIARISSMVSNPNKPHICLFGDVLSDNMMPRLYAASDAFVLISRGEGFGLPAIEAAACNLPVITSRYSGHTDFCDDTNSYLVDVDGFRVFNDDLSKVSYFYEGAEFPIFGKKAIEQTRHLMRYVYEHPDEAQEKANLLTDKVLKEYTWEVCIDSMYEKLKRTFESLE